MYYWDYLYKNAMGIKEVQVHINDISKGIYKAGTSGNGVDEIINGTIKVHPNTNYNVTVEILRNDLASRKPNEYVKSIKLDGYEMGECQPDGGDYDCTFYKCNMSKIINSKTGIINATLIFFGHSRDCDCNTTTWQCAKENTVTGYTPMKAVARFNLDPVKNHSYSYGLKKTGNGFCSSNDCSC